MTGTRSPVAASLRSARDELRTAGPAPGRAWCEAWTTAVDGALGELSHPVAELGRFTVAATGGYGRRELCPWSDIDLLLLHDGLAEADLAALVRAVVYPLWDAGLQVGYAVRGRREAVVAADDVDSATSTLDARRVAGDPSLVRDVREGVLQRLRKRRASFLDGLTAADVDRRARTGDAAEVLEPDLKNGAGGLRDVQSLRWAAAALVGETGLDPLVSARYLGAPDRSRLARAYDRLLAVRVALHLERDRGDDVLHLEHQQAVATRLGYADGADDRDTAAHRLLRDLFLDARTVDHVHRRAWSLVSADAARGRRFRRPSEEEVDGFELVDGVLRLPPDERLRDASLPTRLGAVLAIRGAVLDRTTAAAIRRAVDARREPLAWSVRDRDRFLAMLWRGAPALPAVAELDDVGLVTAAIPEWESVRGRAQRNPYHRYSLDRHAWHAAAALGDLVRREPWAADTLELVEDRAGLMLGVLLHDVGKAHGEPHSTTGVPVARAIADRLRAAPRSLELVGRMVELHLLLPEVATRRDLADPATIAEVARRVGDRRTLACLHLLAAADGLATGPSAWSSWKASLVATLCSKVTAVLDDDPGDAPEATVREAQRLAPELGVDPAVVRDHLAQLPARYVAAVPPRAIVRQAGVAATPLGPGEVRTRVTPGADVPDGEQPADELDVIALDRPGLFAKVAGVLALHGGSVVAANAFSRDDGVAVDTFTVHRPTDATGSWWAAVEGDIDEAVAGRLAVRARVARKAATERRRPGVEVATEVRCELDEAGAATVVEVRTADRLGVLYRIASGLAELELDIVLARVSTIGPEVIDVFYVRDATGAPLDDDHVTELVLAVESALAP
ncbi:MAG: [protein-PII] uridylyltransferase [Actinobacteria bacterium]|nr:[protein-PII] uridylyltransferase [Actinomycetota bacterium]